MSGFRHPGEYFSGKIAFETERLYLRKIEASDADDMYGYCSKEITSRYLLWEPHRSPSATRAIIDNIRRGYRNGSYFELAVVLKENGAMIGTCGLTTVDVLNCCAEIGYVLSPDYWGRGFAQEAAEMMINFAFCELGANRVEAKYIRGNESSRRVMEKCGMTYEGTLRGKMLIKGQYRDIGICAILAERYFLKNRENKYRKFNQSTRLGWLFGQR